MNLETQPNERRCSFTESAHIFRIQGACPVSDNPQKGSELTIKYIPDEYVLEVAALKKFLDSFIGGRGEVRSMEGMIQTIAKECSEILKVDVEVLADLIIKPGPQGMRLTCKHVY